MKFSKQLIKASRITVFVFIPISFIYAQPTKILRVKNGQDATKYISAKDRFEYPDFQFGRLNYTNGKYAVTKLNYCYLLGEVMFISAKGDTLAMADNNQINYADIGNNRFYPFPENGFVEVIEDCGVMLLTKKTQYQRGGIEKKGAYQNSNEIGSVYNASTFTDINGRTILLPASNTILLKPMTTFLFMDLNHRFNKANKGSLLKIFSKNKNIIEKYLDEQNIDFNSEEDLKKVVLYCSEL
ncbi:hypothetical protein [Dyadobacter frigoris]|uniref:WG repeat-containing protein n=1 Tax=Dyadobacter frigoris TaxID=2576211 RepID=A0A4V6BIS1_9BACT|nr:hypothetical protein [Dyadobacter frigoris]TKT90753.1 hypothetical protein FDK13_17445 [Dyadobacter frigoris]GLU52087.1 hypothetical protein Dfri01_15480 [Dyadobacter frigoris]